MPVHPVIYCTTNLPNFLLEDRPFSRYSRNTSLFISIRLSLHLYSRNSFISSIKNVYQKTILSTKNLLFFFSFSTFCLYSCIWYWNSGGLIPFSGCCTFFTHLIDDRSTSVIGYLNRKRFVRSVHISFGAIFCPSSARAKQSMVSQALLEMHRSGVHLCTV